MSIIDTETFFCWPETKPGGLSHANAQLTGSLAWVRGCAIFNVDLLFPSPPPLSPEGKIINSYQEQKLCDARQKQLSLVLDKCGRAPARPFI